MYRCPVTARIARLRDARARFAGEFAQMVRDPLYQVYGGKGYMALRDSGTYKAAEEQYVSKRMREVMP